MSVEIRDLKRKDRKTLSRMIEKVASGEGMNNLLTTIQRPEPTSPGAERDEGAENAKMIEIGINVLKLLLKHLEEDFCTWLADLVGKTPDELDEMAFDIEIQIIEALVSQEGFENFFSGASRLFKKIKKSRGMLAVGKN